MLVLRSALRVLSVPSSRTQALITHKRSPESMSAVCLALSQNLASCSTTTESASLRENKHVVVVGGGLAAGYMAKSFAEAHRGSELCILSSEDVLPYERPALSKGFLFKDGPARLPGFHTSVGGGGERQTEDWYKEKGIEVHLADPVTSIDLVTQNVTTKSGRTVAYKKLVVATGCGARRLDDELGGSLRGVHYLRDHSQALKLYDHMTRCKRVVVIGGSFLGLEAAAACAAWGLPVDVVMREPLVMQQLFPPELSQQFMDHFQARGVTFHTSMETEYTLVATEEGGGVAGVRFASGQELEADLVVVAVGAVRDPGPAGALLRGPGGGLQVDGCFRASGGSSAPGSVFAVGDIAEYPLLRAGGAVRRSEFVDHARRSAMHCAAHILFNSMQPYDYLPYFYSRVFEHKGSDPGALVWAMYGVPTGEPIVVGSLSPKSIVVWVDNGKAVAALLANGLPDEVAKVARIAQNTPQVTQELVRKAGSVEDVLDIF